MDIWAWVFKGAFVQNVISTKILSVGQFHFMPVCTERLWVHMLYWSAFRGLRKREVKSLLGEILILVFLILLYKLYI